MYCYPRRTQNKDVNTLMELNKISAESVATFCRVVIHRARSLAPALSVVIYTSQLSTLLLQLERLHI